MEMLEKLEKVGCSFYKVEGTDIQVCITFGKDWKDIAVSASVVEVFWSQ